MWRLKLWLSNLRFRLWYKDGSQQSHIAFRHTKCFSEEVQLANFREFGPEFQCFTCYALVPKKDISFRILPIQEVSEIKKSAPSGIGILPHVVA